MTSMAFDPPRSNDRHLWDLWLSMHQFPAITAMDEAGVFSRLCEGAISTADLAQVLGLRERVLDVFLGYAVAMELAEKMDDLWQASATTRYWLEESSGGYWGGLMRPYRDSNPLHQRMLDCLRHEDVIKGGASSVEEWERGELPEELARLVAGIMNSHSVSAAAAVAEMEEFNVCRKLLDVGGGSGVFSIALAGRHPHLRADILDIDTMCGIAGEYIDASQASEQVSCVARNMFTESFPAGYDAMFFSNVFHDWSETTNILLAQKAFEALPSGGRIHLHEMLVDDDGCGPRTTLSFSILMLLGTRGKQYCFRELKAILQSAGFTGVVSRLTGSGYYSLVTAQKP